MDFAHATFESLFEAMPRSVYKRKKRDAFLRDYPLFAKFFELARHGSQDEKRLLLHEHPVFLSMSVARCVVQVESLLAAFQPLFEEFGLAIRQHGNQISITTHDDRYPIGHGPIECLWSEVTRGTTTLEQATAAASQPELAGRLSSVYVSALGRTNLAAIRAGEFQRAKWQQQLLMTAVDSIDPARTLANADDVWAMRKWAGVAWVEVATAAFTEVADLRVLAHAVRTADSLIAEARRRADTYLGRILLRKAILFLDPFHLGRPFDNYVSAIERWAALGREAMGADAGAASRQHPMPAPSVALQTALSLFRQTIAIGDGFDRLVCYCAFAQALYRARALHMPVDPNELQEVATTAQQLAEAAGDAARTQYLAEIVEAVAKLYKPRRVRLSDLESSSAMDMAIDEREQINAWKSMLDSLTDTFGPIDLAMGPLRVWDSMSHDLPGNQRIALQVLLASTALACERESEGLDILGDQRLAHENYPTQYIDAVRWLSGNLAVNAGVTAIARGHIGEALGLYLSALHVSVSLNLPSMRSSCMERVLDLVRAPQAQVDLMVALYNYGLAFEQSMSTMDLWNLQQVHHVANAAIVQDEIDHGAHLGALWQLSKGLRLATIAGRGMAEVTRLFGPDTVRRLDKALDEAVTAGEVAPSEGDNDTVLALLDYAASVLDDVDDGSREPSPRSPRARYDRMLEAALLDAAVTSRSLPRDCFPLLSDAELQSALDPSDVLANFYLGQSLSGQLTIYVMLMTTDERHLSAISAEGMQNVLLVADNVVTHPLALLVESLGREIQSNPPIGALVTPDALAELQRLYRALFSGLGAVLDELHVAGKTHLCIVPHGPLHFLPFHLLGASTSPLADKWVVTYLPNLALLNADARRPRAPTDRVNSVAVFACDEWASPAWGSLPEAVCEAKAIADLFGVEPLLENQFDLNHVVAALGGTARYVHIAGHGEMDREAPCFHHLLMAPRDGEDCKLYAYQLQGLDLRGLELVTLSSCQTALGRFDISDNLRGLPAFLFMCGASTIIGTLWDVETSTAMTFFTELYGQLKESEDRLLAFAHAQRVTRERHPEYRDWGAFCYMGDWNNRRKRSSWRSVPGISSLRWTGKAIRQ